MTSRVTWPSLESIIGWAQSEGRDHTDILGWQSFLEKWVFRGSVPRSETGESEPRWARYKSGLQDRSHWSQPIPKHLGCRQHKSGYLWRFCSDFYNKNMRFFASLRDLIMATLQRDRKRREEKKPSTRRGGNQTHYFKSFDLQACAITTKLIG